MASKKFWCFTIVGVGTPRRWQSDSRGYEVKCHECHGRRCREI